MTKIAIGDKENPKQFQYELSTIKELDSPKNENAQKMDCYTMRYRFIKTILMICAWLSFGLNLELTGTTLEDLKILLNVNYQSIAFALVVRSLGYIAMTLVIGLIMDKLLNYSELLMAIAKAFIIVPNFIIPWVKTYWISLCLFLLQGLAQAAYDVGGNQIILRLWTGISNSPVNAMHAGYGIGALVTVQLVKPFIKFNPFENKPVDNQLNNATWSNLTEMSNFSISTNLSTPKALSQDDITLKIPYSVSAVIGFLVMCAFLAAQYIEARNRKNFEKLMKKQMQNQSLKMKSEKNFKLSIHDRDEDVKLRLLQRILFSDKLYETKALIYKLIQIFMIICLFVSINGYITVICAFMLTYLTKGPAKFALTNFFTIQTLFWAFFILSRFLAAVLAFKLSTLVFFSLLIGLNIVCLVLYVIPALNAIQHFYWFIVCAIGLCSGPLIPSSFMVAKEVLVDLNAFLVSIFCVGLGIGALSSQYLTGTLLDKFNPVKDWLGYTDANSAYIIPLYLFAWLILASITYLFILLIHKTFKHIIDDDESDDN